MAKLTERDKRMFELTCEKELILVAEDLGISLDAVHSRFAWIRKKRQEWQTNLNIVLNAERRCNKLKKMLTPTTMKKKGK